MEEERELSPAEALIMKVIWDKGNGLSVIDLMKILKEDYGKDYKRTSIATFLLRLSEKGFVKLYKEDRLSYIHIEKEEGEYRSMLAEKQVDFWFGGNTSELFSALNDRGKISKEDAEKIRVMLDDMVK